MSKKNNFRRYNPLMDEWIIVAANRISRPWQGAKTTKCTSENVENKEANCLSPMSVRSSGIINENYKSTWVFQNDFPSFTEFEKCAEKNENDDLFKEEEICGTCRVICYHPNSQITLATMSYKEIRQVINVWNDQYLELCPKYEWVQIFENRGSIVGCSNMHPHGQLWASNYLPTIPQKKFDSQLKYFKNKGKVMLVDYLEKEIIKNQRIVIRNSYWTILVPFWAFWPYETMILPNRHVINFTDLSTNELDSLAEILQLLLIKYDNIFECSFPYMMGWSSAPSGATYSTQNLDHWQLHCSFFPPLLRSATVPKYLAGYEVFAEKQRDLTPEMAAKNLQNTSNFHYSARNSTTTTTTTTKISS